MGLQRVGHNWMAFTFFHGVCMCARAYNNVKIQGPFVHPDEEVNICCCFLVAKLCLTFFDPMDCSPPGSSVHGIILARILECLAISFSRGSSWLRNRTHISCTASRFFTTKPPGKHLIYTQYAPNWPGGLIFWCQELLADTEAQWV